MDITCISDLHGHFPKLDGGDLLIVAGDLTARDTMMEHSKCLECLHKQEYKKKIVISGNHDNFLQKNNNFFSKSNIEYLCDSGTEFEGLKVWGSPWTLKFSGMNEKCMAFTCDTEEQLSEKWALIPSDTNILITHSPPYGIYDKTYGDNLAGSTSLLIKVAEIKPLIHVFGHIHERGGKELFIPWKNGTRFINASHVNEDYKPINNPIRVSNCSIKSIHI